MDLMQAILERRSVRKYESTPVSDELISELLDAAVWAPSGTNMQPWYFVAVRSDERRGEILDIMQGVSTKFAPVLDERFANYPEVKRDTLSFIESLGGAPVVVLAFLLKDYPEADRFPLEQSIAAAIQNFMLAAHAKGLKTCWLTAPKLSAPQLEAAFGQGKGPFMGMITLGYGEQPARGPKRKEDRFELI